MINKQKLFLIGYMGSGKTTVGKQLARKLNLQFMDMDMFIENRYRKSVSAIFEEKGEAAFREIERRTLMELCDFENVVISTGGGAPCFFDNMELMNQSGTTIYLKVSAGKLAERLKNRKQNRPLIKDKESEEMKDYIAANLEKREPFYNRATFIFESDDFISDENFKVKLAQLIEKLKS